MSIVIGIDPGLRGGIAVLRDGEEPWVMPMPALKYSPTRRIVDAGELARMFVRIVGTFAQAPNAHAFLEQVHAMPKQGVSSSFSFGRSLGVIEGVLATLGIPYTLVTPQRWQREMHQGCEGSTPKLRSRIAHGRLFHSVIADALIDAVLIAEFGRRQLRKGEV